MIEPHPVDEADAARLVDRGEEALVLKCDTSPARLRLSDNRNERLACSLEDGAAVGRVEVVERRVEREADVPRQRLREGKERAALGNLGPREIAPSRRDNEPSRINRLTFA